jgi:hypothetical protein
MLMHMLVLVLVLRRVFLGMEVVVSQLMRVCRGSRLRQQDQRSRAQGGL